MDRNALNRESGAAAIDTAAVAALRDEVARRWRSADPLLPAPAGSLLAALGEPPDGCDDPMIVPGPGGRPVAVGTCSHDRVPPDSMEILWGAAVRYVLSAQVGGASTEEALDRLLRRWRVHLRSLPGTGDADTAATLTWPSRDIAGVRALLGQWHAAPHGHCRAPSASGRPAIPQWCENPPGRP
jgi:hypothetical protein